MARAFAKIAFTPNVVQAQNDWGAPDAYTRFLEGEVEAGADLGPDEAAFIAERDGFYQASVSESGWPYVQFRGGPTGFLKVLDARTLAYADFRGNRQYISTGNLAGNDRVSIILMDYPNQRRLKIWARAQIAEGDAAAGLIEQLHDPAYRARPERAVVLKLEAFDWNCPQHIPMRLTLEELEPHLQSLRAQIARLSDENERLKQASDAGKASGG